jgi:hypothetical protein
MGAAIRTTPPVGESKPGACRDKVRRRDHDSRPCERVRESLHTKREEDPISSYTIGAKNKSGRTRPEE